MLVFSDLPVQKSMTNAKVRQKGAICLQLLLELGRKTGSAQLAKFCGTGFFYFVVPLSSNFAVLLLLVLCLTSWV